MADFDGVGHAEFGILANFGRLRSRAAGEDGVVEGFGGDHGALQAMLLKGAFNAGDGFPLGGLADFVVGEHVGIVGAPVADADFFVFGDNGFKRHGVPRGGVKQGVAFVGSGPLGAGDVVLAPLFGCVGTTAGVHQSADEGLLVFGLYRLHMLSIIIA